MQLPSRVAESLVVGLAAFVAVASTQGEKRPSSLRFKVIATYLLYYYTIMRLRLLYPTTTTTSIYVLTHRPKTNAVAAPTTNCRGGGIGVAGGARGAPSQILNGDIKVSPAPSAALVK